jgi:hypothetical protein
VVGPVTPQLREWRSGPRGWPTLLPLLLSLPRPGGRAGGEDGQAVPPAPA